jgi:hypothetical protein
MADDVDRLRECSRTLLSSLIGKLTSANGNVKLTAQHDGAFRGGSDLFVDAGLEWDEARHHFGRVLGDNIRILGVAGTGAGLDRAPSRGRRQLEHGGDHPGGSVSVMTASWSEEMSRHCATFREVWREHGPEYLCPHPGGGGAVEWMGGEMVSTDRRIQARFTAFSSGDLSEVDGIVQLLEEANLSLTGGFSRSFDDIDSLPEHGEGDAADNSSDTMHDVKDGLVRVQDCLSGAERAARAYRQLLQAFQDDIRALIDQTYTLLEEAKKARESTGERHRLNIATALMAPAAALMPGTTGVAMGASTVSVITALGNYMAGEQSLSLGGSSEGEIIVNMLGEGDKILSEADRATRAVAKAFFAVTEHLAEVSGDNVREAVSTRTG